MPGKAKFFEKISFTYLVFLITSYFLAWLGMTIYVRKLEVIICNNFSITPVGKKNVGGKLRIIFFCPILCIGRRFFFNKKVSIWLAQDLKLAYMKI